MNGSRINFAVVDPTMRSIRATGKGAGYNASFVVDLSLVGGSLAAGDSIYLNLGFRNYKGGSFYFALIPEILN